MKDNRFTRWIFSLLYRRWLWSDWRQEYYTVEHVKGWRTMVISCRGTDWHTMSPLFFWEKI